MAEISQIKVGQSSYDIVGSLFYGEVDSTSTSTVFTATISNLKTSSLYDGLTIILKNGVVTSAADFTININGLGAKPVYSNLATGNDITPTAPTRDTTIFNINYTMMFIYNSTLVDGGAWICYRGYDSNTNTIGYQLRTNSGNRPMSDTAYRYRLYFTSADGSKWVPANTSTSTNATTARTLNTRAIDPFGPIVYNSTNGTVDSGACPSATTLWQQYTLTIGYSYVKTLTAWDSVWLKCQPNTDGSAVMKDIVQALPSSNDGFIYIFLGLAYSTTAMELNIDHPVYYHDGTGIRIWTGAEPESGSTVAVTRSLTSGTKIATLTIDGTGTDLYAPTPPTASTSAPLMDGTASYGSGTAYARSNHVHPTDTSRAASSHVHGSITNAGAITSDTAVASGDKLVISDSSDSSKLKRSGIAFGSDTTTFLRNDGTWAAAGGEVAWDDVTGKPFANELKLMVSADGYDVYKSGTSYTWPMGISPSADCSTILDGMIDGTIPPNIVVEIDGNSYPCTLSLISESDEYGSWTIFSSATVGGVWSDLSFGYEHGSTGLSFIEITGTGSATNPDINIYFSGDEKLNASALPTASASSLGGVKVGSGLSIDDSGVLSTSGGGTNTDTKNTVGATTTSSSLYLVGTTGINVASAQSYVTSDLLYDNGLYSYAYYLDPSTNHYTHRTALDQGGRYISLYNNDTQNNTYNTVSISPASINITANNPSSSVVIESPNNGTYIHNVVTPTANADAVNKEYIDKRINFSDTDDQMWVNWYGEETAIYGQQTQSVTYSFAIHMDDNKTKLTSATLARSYNGTDWDILGTLHPTSSFSNSFVPIGTILDFAGSTAPNGYLICDGRAISRTEYSALFTAIGTTWGTGDGSTTFNLPNLCGRTAIGSGTGTASDATAHALGSNGGTETHVLTPSETATKNHSHTYAKSKTSTDSHTLTVSEIPSHKHSVNERNSSGTSTGWAFMTESGKYAASGTRVVNTGGGGGHTHGIGTTATATTSNPTNANGDAHNNMQPYATVNKIIKAL